MAQSGVLLRSVDGQCSTNFPDGKKPIISGFTGTFGGEVVLNGSFSSDRSAPFHFLRGNPSTLGAVAIGNCYRHSNRDSYNGNGACIYAPKLAGTTVVGETPASGRTHTLSFPASRSCFVTGVIKIETESFYDAVQSEQLKNLRMRNANDDALLLQIMFWDSSAPENYTNPRHFVKSLGFVGAGLSAGYGTPNSAVQQLSGQWIRFLMYYKASSAPGVRDGCSQMLQKPALSNGAVEFDYAESEASIEQVNDQRRTVPFFRFRPAEKCNFMYDRDGLVDPLVDHVEFCYYGREGQIHDIMYDDVWVSDTCEAVWLCTHPTLDESWQSGKIHLAPYTGASSSAIAIDTSGAAPFLLSDNVYAVRVNSNGAESNAVLLRAAE